mgnify:CR=1 FL=1
MRGTRCQQERSARSTTPYNPPVLARAQLHQLVPHRAASRIIAAGICALGVGALSLFLHAGMPVAVLTGWNAGAVCLLALAWLSIASCNQAQTHHRAAADDPGRTLVYVIITLTSVASLFAATVLARRAEQIAPDRHGQVIALCLLAVILSWTLTHTSFTLRYAHLYYREDDEGVGGIDFPGDDGPPTFFDFAYFAFTLGMCFQVSDCSVTAPRVRRAVLVHAVLSFAYNTLILAFTLNLVFGAAA